MTAYTKLSTKAFPLCPNGAALHIAVPGVRSAATERDEARVPDHRVQRRGGGGQHAGAEPRGGEDGRPEAHLPPPRRGDKAGKQPLLAGRSRERLYQ